MYFNSMNEKIIYVGNDSPSPSLDCVLAGVTMPNSDYRISRAPLDVYVFEYVADGEGYIESGGVKYTVSGGTFYCMKRGIDEVHYSSEKEPYRKLWLNLRGDFVDKMYDMFSLDDVFVARLNVLDSFLAMHDKLGRINEENRSDMLAEVSKLLFSVLTDATKNRFFPGEEKNGTLAEKIRSFIDAGIYSDLSVESIAADFGVSSTHTIRVFREKYGTTPHQYILERRISIAKSLLTGTVMPIGEIAALLNYSNTQHFSASFRKSVGCTPHKYRHKTPDGKSDDLG